MKTKFASWLTAASLLLIAVTGHTNNSTAADHVFQNGYIYTSTGEGRVVDAIAVTGNEIIFTGSNTGAQRYIGADTKVHDLRGKMVLPGLHDVHIHALDIADREICDLKSTPMPLEALVPTLKACIKQFNIAEGDWLMVAQWPFAAGNQPSERYPTLRAALDAVSTRHPIILNGNDGHHYAVNSLALTRAMDQQGKVVGLNKQTLQTVFTDYRELISVDENGEPSGGLTESARALVEPPSSIEVKNPAEVMPKIARRLAESGITSIMDALLEPQSLPYFELLEESGQMTFRLQAALGRYYDYPKIHERLKIEDIPETIEIFKQARDRYKDSRYIRPTAAKILVDGVIEGNPLTTPPTLPNAAMLEPFKQPIFTLDEKTGETRISGYVATDGKLCKAVKANLEKYEDADVIAEFQAANGFYPQQCITNNGVYETAPDFLREFVAALDKNGFTAHVHAIGDRAVRDTLDAFEHARQVNGNTGLPHAIAHAQVIHPEDQKRIGKLGTFVAFTHAWSNADPEYQVTIAPFIDELESDTADLFSTDNYYTKNVYPARSIQALGGVVTAGSDAPVDSRDPQPFENMETAIVRDGKDYGNPYVLNADERLDIHGIIEAYTINGARAMHQEDRLGSLEAGKQADFIVIDQNLVELAENGQTHRIGETRILMTWFDGKLVYQRGTTDDLAAE